MTVHYTPKGFVRLAAPELLTEYLNAAKIDLGRDPPEKVVNAAVVCDAIDALPDDTRAMLDRDWQLVWSLASESGLKHIIDEANERDALTGELAPLKSFLDKALTAFLRHRDIFERAHELAALDCLSGRYWKRRLPVSVNPQMVLPERSAPLALALRTYFSRFEGRGRNCEVTYQRRNGLHYFFAYPEDYAVAPLAYRGGELARQPLRPAFEIVFVLHEQGSLDVYAEEGTETVQRLWHLFAQAVLDMEDLPAKDRPCYVLDHVLAPEFQFARPVGSPIEDVRVKRVIYLPHGSTTKVTVDVGDPMKKPLQGELDRHLKPWVKEHSFVIGVQLRARIDRRDGKKPRTRSFDISTKSCALRYEGDDLLLRQMLIDSGIDRTGKLGDAGTGAREAA